MRANEAYAILKKRVDGMTAEGVKAFIEAHPEVMSNLGLAISDGQLCAVFEEGGNET